MFLHKDPLDYLGASQGKKRKDNAVLLAISLADQSTPATSDRERLKRAKTAFHKELVPDASLREADLFMLQAYLQAARKAANDNVCGDLVVGTDAGRIGNLEMLSTCCMEPSSGRCWWSPPQALDLVGFAVFSLLRGGPPRDPRPRFLEVFGGFWKVTFVATVAHF